MWLIGNTSPVFVMFVEWSSSPEVNIQSGLEFMKILKQVWIMFQIDWRLKTLAQTHHLITIVYVNGCLKQVVMGSS